MRSGNLNYTHKMTDLPFLLMILRQNEQGRRHRLWESACSLILTKMHPACGGVGGLLTPEELNLNYVTHEKETHVERPHQEKGLRSPYPWAHHIQANVKRGTNTSDGVSTVGVSELS